MMNCLVTLLTGPFKPVFQLVGILIFIPLVACSVALGIALCAKILIWSSRRE